MWRAIESVFDGMLSSYRRTLDGVLRHPFITLMVFFATMAASVYLYVVIPKGFFPIQDTGLVTGFAEAGQDISPHEMSRLMMQLGEVLAKDPDIAAVGSAMGSSGSAQTANTGRFFIGLKPRDQRKATASDIIDRLRPQLAHIEGVKLTLQPSQDITVGGRIGRGQFQYTLQDADIGELNEWAPKILAKLQTLPQLADVSTDQQGNAPQLMVSINRDQAARFGILPEVIDATLNDAFGQRQVAQYYTQTNTYHVILEVPPEMQGDPNTLDRLYLKSPTQRRVGADLDARHHRQYASGAAFGFASGPVPGDHAVLQSAERGRARSGGRCDQKGRCRHGATGDADRHVPGQRASVPGFAFQRAGA